MAPNWLAVILVLIISALVDGKSPGIKWAQDKDSIYLTISVDCASNKVFKPTANVFDLTCTRRSGEKYSLNFHLREFIKANESSCKSVRGEEECKLTKQNPHYFDRLVKDPNVLKQTLKPDWARWKDEAETDVVQSEDSYDGVSHIKQMNVSAVDTAFKEGAVVVADIYFPWCTQCGYVKKSFIAAAKTLSSDKHIFAKIDAREDHEAALRYNITCDYKCNFYVLQRDESPVPVAGKSSDEEMIKAIKPYFLPAITQITTEEDYTKFRAANPVAAVALLKGNFLSKATDSAEYKALQKAANSVRGKVAVAFSDKSLGGFNPPVIKVFGNTSESRDVPISKNDTELARNILLESLPFVDEYTWSKRDTYDNLGLPIVHAFIDEKSPTAQADEELVLTVAKQFRKKLSFIKLNKIDEYMLKYDYYIQDFGLPEKFPAVGIALNFSYNSVKYAFEGDMNAGSVAEFCSKLLAGSLSPSFKSEAVPTETAKPGQVQKVVWKTLSKILGSEGGSKKDTLLLVYKPWSQGREKAESVLDKVAMALEDIPGFSVGAYDASKNHIDPSAFAGLESEDTQVSLFLVHGDGSRAERFMGPITQKDVLKFLAKKVEAVKANWDNSVKNKLKKMKEAEAERKREAEARAKEEADRKVEELKKLEELVASAEKVDVGEKKDGGIIKQIISAGDGATPTKGDKVSAHYTGTLLDGTKFDSSRDRGEPFSFTLGQGQVIGCWDQAFATMKKGERAMLTCKSEYAYGDRGSPPKIPSKATLRFDVELISFARDEL